MSYYNNVTKYQMSELCKLRKEYQPKGIKIPYCKTYDGAEAVINKYKFTMKGLAAPVTKNQKMIIDILERKHGLKLPKLTDQKQAALIIDACDKVYHVLTNRRLKHYHEECKCRNMAITDNQILVLEGLKLRYGNDAVPEFKNLGEAWDFIAKFQDIIYINENGLYIDNENVNLKKLTGYTNKQTEVKTIEKPKKQKKMTEFEENQMYLQWIIEDSDGYAFIDD